jgi:hypothetical protein
MSAPLTPTGEAAVTELAERYRVSDGAVRALLDAVIRGGGAMAQFSHPDLGGSGQWMRGGMTMVGDMFNPGLQSTVSGICSELSAQLAGGATLVSRPERPTSGPEADRAGGSGGFGGLTGFGDSWWPTELGRPSSSGGQNDAAYAYFPGPRRLAIRGGQSVTLYDTGDHAISGVQQQQGGRGSLEFTSQFGSFTVDTLPVMNEAAGTGGTASAAPAQPAATAPAPEPAAATAPHPAPPPPAAPAAPDPVAPPAPPSGPSAAAAPSAAPGGASTASEIGAAIETLAGLRDEGFLTADEFTAKKTELLARL